MNNYQVNRERWAALSLQEQMGNIGSEVSRSIKAWRAGDRQRFDGALSRALDLFDATTEQLVAQKSVRAKEVLRSKDQFLRLFFDDRFKSDAARIEKYFFQYALAARRNR